MTQDRRTDKRVGITLTARWDGQSGQHEARVEDIGLGGCFVNAVTRVELGEIVPLEIRLPSGEWLQLRGEVISYQEAVGFGLQFTFLTAEEEAALRQLLG